MLVALLQCLLEYWKLSFSVWLWIEVYHQKFSLFSFLHFHYFNFISFSSFPIQVDTPVIIAGISSKHYFKTNLYNPSCKALKSLKTEFLTRTEVFFRSSNTQLRLWYLAFRVDALFLVSIPPRISSDGLLAAMTRKRREACHRCTLHRYHLLTNVKPLCNPTRL